MSDSVSKSWFCVFNNPAEHGYEGTPDEILEHLRDDWISGSTSRTGAWIYCVSAEGLHHVHMVLEDDKAMRFSLIKKNYAVGAHIEPTKGTKDQAEAYIEKRGKWEEKDEQILASLRHGEIKGAQGKRQDLSLIQDLIEQGMKPAEIMELDISYRRYDKLIRDHYFRQRERETPICREVRVVWHVGFPGSGKTYSYVRLLEDHPDDVYFTTHYQNGWLDSYGGERYLFLDEFRGQIKYEILLSMLQGYKTRFYARYTNVIGLWNEVHVSSVFPPELVYESMVLENRNIDSVRQLSRRISSIIYHYRNTKGEYCQYELPFEKYTTYDALRLAACSDPNGFIQLTAAEQLELDDMFGGKNDSPGNL